MRTVKLQAGIALAAVIACGTVTGCGEAQRPATVPDATILPAGLKIVTLSVPGMH